MKDGYLLVGYGTERVIRNANPSELPRGDDGIDWGRRYIEEYFEDVDDAREAAGSWSVSFGEEGGRFYGVILRVLDGNITGIHPREGHHTDEEDHRTAWEWAKHKLDDVDIDELIE